MKREIKFRVWDINKKLFIPNNVYGIITTDFKAFGVMLKEWEEYREGEYYYENAQIVQQFTGLKDKNGKEIYEGDVVRWTLNNWWWTAVIKTIDTSSNLYAIELKHNCTTDENDEVYTYEVSDSRKGSRNDVSFLHLDKTEVIGNIYENPELLNS